MVLTVFFWVATRQDLSVKQTPGGMGGTYCSNAVSCAAALGVLDAFELDDVLGHAAQRHRELLEHLGRVRAASRGIVREIRGAGMMIGMANIAPSEHCISWRDSYSGRH